MQVHKRLAGQCFYRHRIGVFQEMAVRALKQTGSRNIEAALEYISKMGYLDPRNELIVRVIKQTSPGNYTTQHAITQVLIMIWIFFIDVQF